MATHVSVAHSRVLCECPDVVVMGVHNPAFKHSGQCLCVEIACSLKVLTQIQAIKFKQTLTVPSCQRLPRLLNSPPSALLLMG